MSAADIETAFKWQVENLPLVTEHSLPNLASKTDLFGREFQVGDRYMQAVLMKATNCCGFTMNTVPIHAESFDELDTHYRYTFTKLGIPRFVDRSL